MPKIHINFKLEIDYLLKILEITDRQSLLCLEQGLEVNIICLVEICVIQ